MSYSILLKIIFGLLGFTYIGLQALELEVYGSGVSLLMLFMSYAFCIVSIRK